MSRLTRLASQLARIQARIAVIETAYPAIVQVKSYSKGFGEVSATYQDFGPVAREYRELLAAEESLSQDIDALDGTETGSSVATFVLP